LIINSRSFTNPGNLAVDSETIGLTGIVDDKKNKKRNSPSFLLSAADQAD